MDLLPHLDLARPTHPSGPNSSPVVWVSPAHRDLSLLVPVFNVFTDGEETHSVAEPHVSPLPGITHEIAVGTQQIPFTWHLTRVLY